MNARTRTVRALATLSLGLLMLPAASFAKSSSSSSSHSSSHSSTSSTSSGHTSTTSVAHPINLSKPAPSVSKPAPSAAPGKVSAINLAKPSDTAPKTVTAVVKPAVAVAPRTATPVPVAPATGPVKTPTVVVAPRPPVVSNANTGTWFGGHYEVFDRPGVNATRVYRSDSAFSTARWLMDHKAYHAHQVVNAGYELRTSGQVLDQGTQAFDRWIEQNR